MMRSAILLITIAAIAFATRAQAQQLPYIPPKACTAACVIGPLYVTVNQIGAVSIKATGTGAGLAYTFQGSTNGTDWDTLPGVVPNTGAVVFSASANGNWIVPVASYSQFRVNVTGLSSGTETFSVTGAPGVAVVYLANSGGGGGGGGSTVNVTPGACADTAVTLSAATSTTLLAATSNLKSLCLMNIGLNPVTFVNTAGSAAVGSGQAINGASSAGQQGGGYCYPVPPTNAVKGYSTAGSTVIVETCQ